MNPYVELCFTGGETPVCANSCIPTECADLSNQGCKRRYIPSVTSALIVGSFLGLVQAVFLIFSAKVVLGIMGVKHVGVITISICPSLFYFCSFLLSMMLIHIFIYITLFQDSPMLEPAVRYLTIRSLGAPAVLLSLAMQGVFRGFKDTKTPLYATGKNTW